MTIPKIIVQTSRQKPDKYIVDMIRERSPGWDYMHFTDDEIMEFFSENPIPEFSNIIAKFFTFNYGEHRADLFRYYYLYVKGGVYIDMDAMIEENMDDIIGNADFFTVNSNYFPGTVFQGFLGATPKNPLIYKALFDIYHISNNDLIREFHILCKNLYLFIQEEIQSGEPRMNIKLLEEVYGNNTDAYVKDGDKLVLIHYHIRKIIPKR
uniref:Glycosyltransferase n=1 Tax=viral metagenome TaxID=1070528 RepID=A0A6C0JKX9_9ZZZZ